MKRTGWLCLGIITILAQYVNTSCDCSSGLCTADCSSYQTNGQSCTGVSDCTTCQCGSGSQCSPYCSSSTNYYTKSQSCSSSGQCTSCSCVNGACNGLCSSYKTQGNTCILDTDCKSCKCAKASGTSSSGTCNGACSSYGTNVVGSTCSTDTDCTSCKCNGLGKCSQSCESYETEGNTCTSNSQCTAASLRFISACSCFTAKCITVLITLITVPCGPTSCYRTTECANCVCSGGTCSSTCSSAISGASCISDTDCSSCKCSAGKCSVACTSGISGKNCLYDSDCSSCQCSAGVCTDYCSSVGTSGNTCTQNADCNSCTCSRGVCTQFCGRSGLSCTYNSDCALTTTTTSTTTTSTTTTTTSTTTTSSTTTTTTTDTTTTASPINLVVGTIVDLDAINSNDLIGLLSNTSQDLTGCLVNCSSKGQCVVNGTGYLICKCSQYYTGSSCDQNTLFCASSPCLNGATCLDQASNSSLTSFTCNCSYPYYGVNCENKINLCENVTCSGYGTCVISNNTDTSCDCYYLYLGDDCAIESDQMKAVKAVIKSASIIACIFIVSFYAVFVIMDILHYLLEHHERRVKKIKFKYIAKRGDTRRMLIDHKGRSCELVALRAPRNKCSSVSSVS